MLHRLLKWVYKPLNDITGPNYIVEKVTPGMQEYQGRPKIIYRPKQFEEYIGQSKAKSILKSRIEAMRQRQETMGHVLLSGKAGYGKTTLASIIAHELGVPYKEMVTSTIGSSYDLLSVINQVDGGVLLLDEIHSIDRGVGESIYSIMEDFKYNGQPIKPFTLVGATTELGELYRTRRPLVDRFKLIIELEDYNLYDLTRIIRQYRNIMFPADTIDVVVYDTIAENCRQTPRMALRLLEDCVYMKGDIAKVLYNSGIIVQGYTIKDLEILKYLAGAPYNLKGIRTGTGVTTICSYLGTSDYNYTQIIEPYLLRNNLIVRTGQGRKITLAGETKILELEIASKSTQ